MFNQCQKQGDTSQLWDDVHTEAALVAATHHAARWGRCSRRQRADTDDLRQDILVAILERAAYFDPAQATWPTFVSLLARHVVADRHRADAQAAKTAPVLLDLVELSATAALTSITQPEAGDDELASLRRIDLQHLAEVLPEQPRETLDLLVMTQGDVAAAQRASGSSCSAFYRAVADLRLWLRAGGLATAPQCRGKNRELDR